MGVEKIAEIWVFYIEPGIKIFLMFLAVMFVLQFWQVAKDPKKHQDVISKVYNWTMMALVQTVVYSVTFLVAVFMFIVRIIHVVFATIRDFFISRT